MTISGINPNIGEISILNIKPENKAAKAENYTGQSFNASFLEVARSARMQTASGNNAASLNLNNSKEEGLEELFSFVKAEDELAEDYLKKLNKLLNDLKK